ncbi:MAG TPA: ABC transporter ATP-binding protein [Actinomycetota bacterium]|jgi:putative ABC transport system ATP-binding protein|nr:ABC transporter ATP-binding protein [Actinomycetota bacterium]
MDDRALLEGSELRRRFGKTTALDGVSLTLEAGEVVAVMGPSGSGKSTLLHCLAGILPPDDGEVWFNGDRIDELGDGARTKLRRSAFGFVFQLGQLVFELSLAENVALPLLLGGRDRRSALAESDGWLERLGVGEVAGHRPGEVSAGQAQRAAVARALIHGPRVVFADEPTGALDSLAGEQVMELLVGAAREQGAAVLLVTHDVRVAAYADREVIVRDGRVANAPVSA